MTHTLDEELKVALQRFQRMRWLLAGMIAVVLAAGIAVGIVMLLRQNRQLGGDSRQITANQEQIADDNERLLSSCDFYRPLTPLPVTIMPGTGKPTQLSVQIIAAAREAYLGQGCSGRIPPPDPSFVKWAAYFRVPVRG